MTTIYLYDSTLEKIHREVIKPTTHVKTLKNLLRRSTLKLTWAECDWYFNNLKLEDNVTLSNVPPYATIICKDKPKNRSMEEKINITVKGVTGKALPLSVSVGTTIKELKLMIEEMERVPEDPQRQLICAGQQLQNNRTVSDYNLQDGAVLHLVLRLRGSNKIFDCGLYGLGRKAYIEVTFPFDDFLKVHKNFVRVCDVHGVQLDGEIEVEGGLFQCRVLWTPKELMRIGSYTVTLDPTACDEDTRPKELDALQNQPSALTHFVYVEFPDIMLQTKRMGSEEAPRSVVLSFTEPADQTEMFRVLKRNIAANWGIEPQQITSIVSGRLKFANGDVVIEDDAGVFQLQTNDLIHFGVDA